MVLEAGMSVLSRGTSMPLEFLGGQGPGGQVQVPADGLGDLADGHAFVADGVEHRAGGSLLDGQPVQARGVLHVDGGPAAGPVADVAGDALGPGRGDELGDEAVTFSLAVHRAGQHDQAGADAPALRPRGRPACW